MLLFLAFSVVASGCEAVVDFDRSKIDGGAKSAALIPGTLGVSDGGVATPDTDPRSPPDSHPGEVDEGSTGE